MAETMFGTLIILLLLAAAGMVWVPLRDAPKRKEHLRGHQVRQEGEEFV